ncbi:MAG: DUF3224 domain-containing protein [Chloroflexota bacterium]|nr:DUF3224 domain-containing protein [Chloroflexota bacterium]
MHRNVTSAFTTANWVEREIAGAAHALRHGLLRYGVSYFGEVSGTSSVALLVLYRPDGTRPFIGHEFFEGSIGQHSGTVVFEHRGEITNESSSSELGVVPGTATGALANVTLTGRMFVPEDGEGMIALDMEMANST